MESDDRNQDAVNATPNEITEADIEELCKRVALETAHTGLPPHRVIAHLAEEHLRPDLDRQRGELEERHEDETGRVGREHLPVLLREQERECGRLEYHLSLQVRELAAAVEDIYWSRHLQDRPEAVENIPEAMRRLQDRHREDEAALAMQHDKDLEWLHGEPNVRRMLTWVSRLSPRAVDAALAGLRQLHQGELDVLKARHEHDIRMKALALEHEHDRALASGMPSPDPGPRKAGLTNERPRRIRKPDLDFER